MHEVLEPELDPSLTKPTGYVLHVKPIIPGDGPSYYVGPFKTQKRALRYRSNEHARAREIIISGPFELFRPIKPGE